MGSRSRTRIAQATTSQADHIELKMRSKPLRWHTDSCRIVCLQPRTAKILEQASLSASLAVTTSHTVCSEPIWNLSGEMPCRIRYELGCPLLGLSFSMKLTQSMTFGWIFSEE